MDNLFKQNKVFIGIFAEILSLALPAALLSVALVMFGISPLSRIRWFAGIFIPGILVVRFYARKKEFPKATKASVVSLFVCFVAFVVYLASVHQLF